MLEIYGTRRVVTQLPERIAENIWVNPDTGCWEWQRQRNAHGYGLIRWGSGMQMIHNVVYRLLVGPIPLGKELDHLCKIRHCCNIKHLEPVTHRENVLRGDSPAAIEARSNTCPKGHPRDPDHVLMYRGWRVCRICANERSARWNAKRKKMKGISRPYLPR